MPITATVSLTVPTLTDNAIAFANAAAWNNYWNNISANITLVPIDVDGYTPASYNTTLTPYQLNVDADVMVFPSKAQFDSLLALVLNLEGNYDALRQKLYDGGLIDAP